MIYLPTAEKKRGGGDDMANVRIVLEATDVDLCPQYLQGWIDELNSDLAECGSASEVAQMITEELMIYPHFPLR